MKRTIAAVGVFFLSACLSLVPAAGILRQPEAAKAPVVNQVLDLLSVNIPLRTVQGQDIWQSTPFDTSQFTRIGVRTSGTTDGPAWIRCSLAWQFSPDDTFQEGAPSAFSEMNVNVLGDDPSLPDGIRDIYARYFTGPLTQGVQEVQGTRAKVICTLETTALFRGDYGGEQQPDPSSVYEGVLSDVKVLLRRP